MAKTEPVVSDPERMVSCRSCGWSGPIKECNPQPSALVVCPKCGKAVEYVKEPSEAK